MNTLNNGDSPASPDSAVRLRNRFIPAVCAGTFGHLPGSIVHGRLCRALMREHSSLTTRRSAARGIVDGGGHQARVGGCGRAAAYLGG